MPISINDLEKYWKGQPWIPYKVEYTYDPHPQYICPKCGLDDISCHFREKGQKLDDDIFSGQNYAEKELLRMYCRFCGFSWNEDTQEEKAQKEKELFLSDWYKKYEQNPRT